MYAIEVELAVAVADPGPTLWAAGATVSCLEAFGVTDWFEDSLGKPPHDLHGGENRHPELGGVYYGHDDGAGGVGYHAGPIASKFTRNRFGPALE